jgi:hypothetical protein
VIDFLVLAYGVGAVLMLVAAGLLVIVGGPVGFWSAATVSVVGTVAGLWWLFTGRKRPHSVGRRVLDLPG